MQQSRLTTIISSLATATVLGLGALVVFDVALFTASTLLGLTIPNHPLADVAMPTIMLLSPFLLSAALFLQPPSKDFVAYLSYLSNEAFFGLVVLALLSVPLAIGCYVHQRRFDRRAAVVWRLYVLVMGVPGAIGYWLHRRWPPKDRCRQCDRNSPRDRLACYYCGAYFPTPPKLGTEILRPPSP